MIRGAEVWWWEGVGRQVTGEAFAPGPFEVQKGVIGLMPEVEVTACISVSGRVT